VSGIDLECLRDTEMAEVIHYAQCLNCLSCEAVCPALTTDQEWLGPSVLCCIYRFLTDPRDSAMEERLKLISDDLWYCSQCNACNVVCPFNISISDSICKMREYLIERGVIPRTIRDALLATQRYGNPWGIHWEKRARWAQGLNVEELTPNKEYEVLLFTGCTCSSDPRAIEISRSLVKILNQARIDFAILGKNERCCGEPILRLGERGLFDILKEENMRLFEECKVQRIVTICPHGYDIFKHHYPVKLEVEHYTQFLSGLIESNNLKFTREIKGVVAYHDPCFLGRRNSVYEEPRTILENIPGLTIAEFPRSRENSFCCGGGGGRVWMEEKTRNRPSLERVREALAQNVEKIITACPFCLINLEDATNVLDVTNVIEVRDIAEIVAEATTTPKL